MDAEMRSSGEALRPDRQSSRPCRDSDRGLRALIASICTAHGAALGTGNAEDAEHTGIGVVDPWCERS